MKLIEELHRPLTPKIKAVHERRAAIDAPRQRLSEVTLMRVARESEVETLRGVAMRNLSLESFDKWRHAADDLDSISRHEQLLHESIGWAKSELAGYNSDAGDILLAALKELRDRCAKRIKEINDAMAKQASELGLEPAEHPGLAPLRSYLAQLADAIVAHEGYGEGMAQSYWECFNHLVN